MPCPNCRCSSCLETPVGSPIPFSPPPSELMTTNRPPINSEVAYSRDVIRSIGSIVSLIQAKVDDLETQKAELSDLIDKHKAAISPLRSFPPELLAKVFIQSVAIVEYGWGDKHSPPLMLMGICSRWRSIVLDTPRLWTKIISPHPMIDSWITRSRELPLHLELDLTSSDSYPALDALIPHSHRWEHVDFGLDPGSIPALARVKAHLPSLKRLDLLFGDASGTVDFCEVAPQLAEIKLMGVCGPDPPVILKLPWEQLRICTVDGDDVARYVLQHAENLQRLHLDMSEPPESPWSLMDVMPYSRHLGLDTLIIDWNSLDVEAEINSFFSTTLPSLRTLEVHLGYPDPEATSRDDFADDDDNRDKLAVFLTQFFEQSCTHLSTLILTGIPFSPWVLTGFLRYSPSLISLDIQFHSRWYAVNEDLLSYLDINHRSHILPHLQSLALRGLVDVHLEESIDAPIASRRHIDPEHDGVALLEDLILDFNSLELRSRIPRFHRFASEGLSITYGKDWPIYDAQGDDSASLEEQA